MNPELRMLGISPKVKGYGIMEQMLYRAIRHDDLTYNEVKEVLDAWETRHNPPPEVLEDGNIDHVSPTITKEDVKKGLHTQEEYDRDYVRVINAYLLTIWA